MRGFFSMSKYERYWLGRHLTSSERARCKRERGAATTAVSLVRFAAPDPGDAATAAAPKTRYDDPARMATKEPKHSEKDGNGGESPSPKPRGRPRTFDLDEGIVIAQRLFEARGYSAVSVADLTAAIGINPPSFYSAYGSKAELFARALERYSAGGIPVAAILSPGRPVAEALGHILEDAAGRYARDALGLGCMVIEATHSDDVTARDAASACAQTTADAIHAFVARTHPALADALTDYVITVMIGLSAMARAGTASPRLAAVARIASAALAGMIAAAPKDVTAQRRATVTRGSRRRR
jgi:TetR/AcrR family transcriptional regulator, repressor for divergent bdcA